MLPDTSSSPQTIYLKDYTPAPYLASSVALRFELFEDKTLVHAEVRYEKNPAAKNSELVLHGQDQTLISVQLNGEDYTDYRLEDNRMLLADLPAQFTLTISSEIHPESNTALEGLYKSQGTFCTQCEA